MGASSHARAPLAPLAPVTPLRPVRPTPRSGHCSRSLTLVVVAYAGSLIVRGPNGASPTWLDGWGVAAFELVASVLVLVRAWVSPRDPQVHALWLRAGLRVLGSG